MADKYILDDVEFYTEDNEWYMKLKYIVENDREVYELHIPKVAIGLNIKAQPMINITTSHDFVGRAIQKGTLTVADNEFDIQRGNVHDLKSGISYDNILYLKRTLKEKTHKMTVAEIEKKLGYKIEIVAEDGK